jgi:hypothetical protein
MKSISPASCRNQAVAVTQQVNGAGAVVDDQRPRESGRPMPEDQRARLHRVKRVRRGLQLLLRHVLDHSLVHGVNAKGLKLKSSIRLKISFEKRN